MPEILATLERYQVDPNLIEIEITESMVMSDFAAAKSRMDQLVAAGVVISIDDFGTGYSNLSQLSRLPFKVLKMDKSLIDGLGENAKSEAIVSAIVLMAHALGHKVVAEGIETPAQHHFLKKLRCDQVQGFLFGRPMPAAMLVDWELDRDVNAVAEIQDSIVEKLNAA